MTALKLTPSRLRLRVDPARLGFADTRALLDQPVPWIGQARAEQAARFGLSTRAPDHHLLVLGEPGSGRSSLMAPLMRQLAALRPPSTDLCFVHNFDDPARPLALRLPAGHGRLLRDGLQALIEAWITGVPPRLTQPGFVAEVKRLQAQHGSDVQALGEALLAWRRQHVKPLLDDLMRTLQQSLSHRLHDAVRLTTHLRRVHAELLSHVGLLNAQEPGSADEEMRLGALEDLLARLRINLLIDRHGDAGAPVVVDQDPSFRGLFGSIGYQASGEVMDTDFMQIRAGSLLQADGGFLMLHLRDVIGDELMWEKFRRFLRCGRLQIEEPSTLHEPVAATTLVPEALTVDVKVILLLAPDEYYALQQGDPELARRLRVKVDFADSFLADADTWHATAVWVAQRCREHGLPHFTAAAVAALIEETHRAAEDQARQSAAFGHTEALLIEAASQAQARADSLTHRGDVLAAREARRHRHDQPEQRLLQTIAEGERVLEVRGQRLALVNGLTVIDLGDHRFGWPARVTACTHAGEQGLLNIEREVELSGPIHDKGVLILHSYLAWLFSHLAPLALNASIGFDQEYGGVEGDSASCAEFCALLSSLSGLPLRQDLAVTGAINQHGEMLPVGGINEKIEGFFKACEQLGLSGTQGVIIPQRNARHLMLEPRVLQAVSQGQFQVYAVDSAGEAMALLTGLSFEGEVLPRAERTLQRYRLACEAFTAQQHLAQAEAMRGGVLRAGRRREQAPR